jgi:hypothetical protein
MTKTILTTQEAITFGPGDGHLAGSKLSEHICTQEEKFFNERFGWAFYQKLLGDIFDYKLRTGSNPATDGDKTRYFYYENLNRTDIVEGDFVLSGDVVFEAILDVDQAGIQVANIDYYKRADKFKTPVYEQVYTRYLRGIIATSVARTSVVSGTFQQTSLGGLKKFEEGKSKSLTAGELAILKSEYQTDIEDMITNMERFILRHVGSEFELYGKVSGSNCGETDSEETLITQRSGSGTRARNYGFSLRDNNSIR